MDGNPFKLEMSATWARKTEALKFGAQFQCITVEIKERIETQNPQVRHPTKPPTDRHYTNFTKEHQSLKVSSVKLLISGLSLIWMKKADLYSKNTLSLVLK